MTDEAEIREIFADLYGYRDGVYVGSASGRVNIIGEHTDYNQGYVLPTPMRSRVWVAARRRSDDKVRAYATDYQQKYDFSLNNVKFNRKRHWANYVMGVFYALQRGRYGISGSDIVVKGDVPQEMGLSSSAAIEVATAKAIISVNDLDIAPVDIAYLGKVAENEFVGVQSGIMDQFCASLGTHGNAMLIDCRSNEYAQVQIPQGYEFIAVHTGIKRKLDSSAYNDRVNQCKEGIRTLHEINPKIESLRDASISDLEEAREKLSSTVYKRCHHVISENSRVLQAVSSMRELNTTRLGALMFDSHLSLKEDYDVSCQELDTLVEIAKESGYVLGSRLTGAGFGGCTINLLPIHKIQEFKNLVKEEYRHRVGLDAEVYAV